MMLPYWKYKIDAKRMVYMIIAKYVSNLYPQKFKGLEGNTRMLLTHHMIWFRKPLWNTNYDIT